MDEPDGAWHDGGVVQVEGVQPRPVFGAHLALPQLTSQRLLAALVRRPVSCSILLRSASWHALCGAMADASAPIGADAARHLARAVTSAAVGAGDAASAAAYVAGLLQGHVQGLESAVQPGGGAASKAMLQRGEVVARIVWRLEALRGGVLGAQPIALPALCELAAVTTRSTLALISEYSGRPEIVTLVLKFGVAVAQSLLVNADIKVGGWTMTRLSAGRSGVQISIGRAWAYHFVQEPSPCGPGVMAPPAV